MQYSGARTYYNDNAVQHCRCGKTSAQKEHYIWIAFLHHENEEYEQEQCCVDYYVMPINSLTQWWTNSDIIHCQIALWENDKQAYTTYSVDSGIGRVWKEHRNFSRRGWTFARITVTMDQENAVRNFLEAQIGKPFNKWGINLFWLCPWSGENEKWFCSELTMAALQSAGLYTGYAPAECYPSLIRDIVVNDRQRYLPDAHIVRLQSLVNGTSELRL